MTAGQDSAARCRHRADERRTSIAGYEMHLGATSGAGASRPMIRFDDGKFDGAVSADGRIAGCHVHGLFADPAFRAAYLATLGARSTGEITRSASTARSTRSQPRWNPHSRSIVC